MTERLSTSFRPPTSLTAIIAALLLLPYGAIAAKKKGQTVEPDYTKGEVLMATRGRGNNFCNLGSTGAIGNIWANKQMTADARKIQIKEVLKGTPADGILRVGDVILGVGNETFSTDVRKAFAQAITYAETEKGGGKLKLKIWRPTPNSEPLTGTEHTVTINLPVLGTYSSMSPWNCEKSEAVIGNACKFIVRRGFFKEVDEGKLVPGGGIPGKLEALGLLATGEPQYLPIVQEYARAIAPKDLTLKIEGLSSWYSSYTLLFLAEYYLITKDKEVLPALTEYATKIAMGRSGVGTWSHGMAKPSWNGGKLYGKASAYGSMNQVGLTCTSALLLARECGVKTEEVDTAIRLSTNFFRWYVDKGAIPYGDHVCNPNHDNNGVNSQAAVMFDLAGEKDAVSYFNRTGLASYTIREVGHTGHFFAWQWGALGAGRGGEKAAQSFIKNTQWFTELERRHDGSFVYQPQLNNKDHGKYIGWSTTGSRLLQFCLPHKKLRITGRGKMSLPPISDADIKEAVAAGAYSPDADDSTEALLKDLGSRWPYVREHAAKALGDRDDDLVQTLITLLESENRYARYGACNGLYYAGRQSPKAVAALMEKVLDPSDITLRRHAVLALKIPRTPTKNALGDAVREATPALLKLAATPDPENDPGSKLHRIISDLLFYGGRVQPYRGHFPKGEGIERADRELVISVIKSLLKNPNGAARTNVSRVYPYLKPDDIKRLWNDIYWSTKNEAPSGVMASGGDRIAGLRLMAENNVKEGIPLAIDYGLRQEGWGNRGRKTGAVPPLLSYGGALRPYVPEIEEILKGWGGHKVGSKNYPKDAEAFRKQLADALKNPSPKLTSIKKYIEE